MNPDGHLEHKLALELETKPYGHGEQNADAAAEKEFARHGWQTEQPEAELQKVPAGHGVQLKAPGGEKKPEGHMSHEELPDLFWKVPDGHLEHMLEPISLMEPGLHGLQVEEPTDDAVPGGQ